MSKLVRNPTRVLDQLYENKKGELICKESCIIQVPERFSQIGLGRIGVDTITYGCFPLILEDGSYSVFNINSLIELNPARTIIVKIDDVDYHQFEFEAYQTVIKTTSLVQRDDIIFNVFDEFIFKGKVPWYMEYDDLGKLFHSAKEYAGSSVSKNEDVIEFIVSMISRYKDDREHLLRVNVKDYKDIIRANVSYIPLNSVFFMNNTMNKLAGSYFNDGVVSALVNPSTNVEKLEQIIRA